QRLAPGAGAGRADRVGRRHEDSVDVVDGHVVVVARDGVEDLLARLPIALGQFGADLRVAALHLVVRGLADVVWQPAAPPRATLRPSPILSAIMPHSSATSIECCNTFWL